MPDPAELIDRCEWNSFLMQPSQDPSRPTDCDQPARWSVGTGRRNIHLCEGCAALPYFRRLRKRARLRSGTMKDGDT